MNHQINIDEAIAIAKEYHLEAEVTECINRSINRMGLNINKKYDKAYKYYNAKHNITRMLRYINIYIICINHIY